MLKELDKSFMDIVNEPLDPSLIRKDYSGNKYITGYTIVKLLNRLTNGAWDWKIDNFWKDKITHKYKKNGKVVEDGERICQMVIARHEQVDWQPVEQLDPTERGEGGFGHTGVK
mgnify:CR=1 FL=1